MIIAGVIMKTRTHLSQPLTRYHHHRHIKSLAVIYQVFRCTGERILPIQTLSRQCSDRPDAIWAHNMCRTENKSQLPKDYFKFGPQRKANLDAFELYKLDIYRIWWWAFISHWIQYNQNFIELLMSRLQLFAVGWRFFTISSHQPIDSSTKSQFRMK